MTDINIQQAYFHQRNAVNYRLFAHIVCNGEILHLTAPHLDLCSALWTFPTVSNCIMEILRMTMERTRGKTDLLRNLTMLMCVLYITIANLFKYHNLKGLMVQGQEHGRLNT